VLGKSDPKKQGRGVSFQATSNPTTAAPPPPPPPPPPQFRKPATAATPGSSASASTSTPANSSSSSRGGKGGRGVRDSKILLAPQVASLLGAGLGMSPSVALEDMSAPEEEDYGDEEAQVRFTCAWKIRLMCF